MKLEYRFNEWREGPPWKYDGDITVLPSAGRVAMLEKDSAWREDERARKGLRFAGLLPESDETVTGPNGDPVPATTSLEAQRKNAATAAADRSWLYEGGWQVVSIKGGDQDGGITSHRGVLADGEYVDAAELQRAIEAELGFSYDQIRSVYRQGPLAPAKREIRDVIDARMLALRRSGTNLVELGKAIGLTISYDGHCRTLDNAVSRARAVEQWKENLR